MGGAIETHFKLIDFAKEMLYNAKSEDEIQNAEFLLEQAKRDEESLMIEEEIK